jgi:hypothetical protein
VIFGAATIIAFPPSDDLGPLFAPVSVITQRAITDQQGQAHLEYLHFQEEHWGGGVHLDIWASFDRKLANPVPYSMSVTLPFGARATSDCQNGYGPNPAHLECHIDRQPQPVQDMLDVSGDVIGDQFAPQVFLQDSPGVSWRDGHSKVLVNLPILMASPVAPHGTIKQVTTYAIPALDKLAWPNPPPITLPGSDVVEWHYVEVDNSYYPITAVKDGVEQQDAFRTFLAGAFIALASATFVEALAEVASIADRRRALRRLRQ